MCPSDRAPPQCQAKGGGDSSKALAKTDALAACPPDDAPPLTLPFLHFQKATVYLPSTFSRQKRCFLNTQGPEVTRNVLSQFTCVFPIEDGRSQGLPPEDETPLGRGACTGGRTGSPARPRVGGGRGRRGNTAAVSPARPQPLGRSTFTSQASSYVHPLQINT